MNCVDPIDGQSYREIEKQTFRGAFARYVANGTRGRIAKRRKGAKDRCRTSSTSPPRSYPR